MKHKYFQFSILVVLYATIVPMFLISMFCLGGIWFSLLLKMIS
nr:MAG TPA: hypothetical protein [Caudoviricetes sp.]